MGLKLLLIVFSVKIVVARITLDVNVDNDQKVNISYTGTETRNITEDDMNSFKLGKENFDRAFTAYVASLSYFTQIACQLALSKYSNCEDFDKDIGRPKRFLSIKSASVKALTKKPVVVVSQDFENSSNRTIKVNTGISHNIENTLTTSWSEKQQLIIVSQDAEYEINLGIVSVGGKTDFSFTTKGGVSGEKSKTEIIGTTNGTEVELKPGEAVTAVLSANAGYLEIEVVHMASIQGPLCHKRDKLWFVWMDALMTAGGLKNEITTTETIKFNFYVEAQLRVYEKKTGRLIF